MECRVKDLYNAADIRQVEDVHLMALWENCATLENHVYAVLDRLSTEDRQIVETYIDLRNELELESVKAALRMGKHYNP